MIGSLLEEHRQTLILVLSVLILAGSGISLGVGIVETQQAPDYLKPSNLEKAEGGGLNLTESLKYPLNINTATAAELESLPGIGQTRAKAIVDYRQSKGAFKTIEEITSVPGIGPKTFERIKGLIMVGQ